jgi:lipoprotein-releasing system permease protein
MDFKLFVALKYLLPKRQHLASSFIAFISIFVISLVVWLVLLFFSVTENMEKNWQEKLTALNAPLRITPEKEYFNTYYYQSDLVANSSNYMAKTFAQKLHAKQMDPRDPNLDEHPMQFEQVSESDGTQKDLIKELYSILKSEKEIEHISDLEVAGGSMRLRLVRESALDRTQTFMSAVPYFFAFDPHNEKFAKTLCSIDAEDLNHLLSMLELSSRPFIENSPNYDEKIDGHLYQERMHRFFNNVKITHLKPKHTLYKLPFSLIPSNGKIHAKAFYNQGYLSKVVLGNCQGGKKIQVQFLKDRVLFEDEKKVELLKENAPIYLSDIEMEAQLDNQTLDSACQNSDLVFKVRFYIQNFLFENSISLYGLAISRFELLDTGTSYFVSPNKPLLFDPSLGYGVILPKIYKKKGVLVGDMGYLGYSSMQMTNAQEQRVSVFVAGFYEPGLSPIANKIVLVDQLLTTLINSSATHYEFDKGAANGFLAYVKDLNNVDTIKARLEAQLKKQGLFSYFKIETFKEFEFVQSFFKQFQSDRQLVAFVALFILLVACSNVISFLILLVNSKRKEIGILQAMGASRKNIIQIFCLCGVIIGMLSTLLGSVLALFTLKHLNWLVQLFGFLQQNPAFDSELYGSSAIGHLSTSAFLYVLFLTPILSLLASFVPAYRASKINPCDILRSE